VDDTPNLGLPYIMAAQSQKHVTHNEAIRALDAIVQLAVLDRDLAAPPSSPADGARYIVGGSPTGAWSGHAGSIAAFQDGAWMYYAPVEGWIAWIGDEDAAVVWDGAAWSALTTGGGGGGGSGSFTTLGVNATADTTNRLTLAADATLLSHDGDGHQLKINKASASDTASLLYQDAFSGRAELGLAGDDDFHFKVSPDGSSWKEAIVIDRTTAVVTLPFTPSSGGSSGTVRRNRWLNGALQISQQNENTAGTADGYYVADLLSVHRVTSAGTITAQRVQSATPGGAKDRARITITTADSSSAAGECLYVRTRIEGQNVADFRYGTASARQAILRFLFKGPSGTYAVRLTNSAKNRSYVGLFSPAAANTDEIIELVIPGDTSGTWLTDAGVGIETCIVLACGSTFQGAAGWQAGDILGTSGVSNGMATGSAVFEVGEFGLYLDPDATGLAPEWELPNFSIELLNCLRYYEVLGSSNGLEAYGVGQAASSSRAIAFYSFKAIKRASPTLTLSAAGHWAFYNATITAFVAWVTVSPQLSVYGAMFDVSGMAAGLGGTGTCALFGPNSTASARMYFDARL
jgi:hypothetical protein